MTIRIQDLVSIVLRTLDLIILSYAGAHIGDFDDSPSRVGPRREFFKIAASNNFQKRMPCVAQKGSVTLARRMLKCLSGFFANQKAWVFHEETVDPRSNTSLLLSTTPDDFADIWGPMWRIKDPETPFGILRYDLENGSIIPSELKQGSHDTDVVVDVEESLCHWVSDSDLRESEASSSSCHLSTSISNPRLLIGAKKKIRLKENEEKCDCNAAKITKQLRNADYL